MKKYIFWILLLVSTNSCKVLQLKNLDFEKYFGGVGDGKTDNYDAFVALNDYIKGKNNIKIIFNEGIYIVNTQTKGNVLSKIITSDIIHISHRKNIKLIGIGDVQFKYKGEQYFGTFNEDLTPKIIKGEYYGSGRLSIGNFIFITNSSNIEIKNIEVDGNIGNMIIGGPWGDTGFQIPHFGLIIKNSKDIKVSSCHFHHFGCDGVMIDNSDDQLGANRNDNILIDGVISEYNGRQGMSVVGVNGLVVKNSQFNHQGKNGKVSSSPGAGVDLEAESGTVRNGIFENCKFINNNGCGLVADSGESENWKFYNCTFWGIDNWSLWARKRKFHYFKCTFVGSIVNINEGKIKNDASYFEDCVFSSEMFNDKLPYGNFLVELNGIYNTIFKRCVFNAKYGQIPFWIDSSMIDSSNINRIIDCDITFDLEQTKNYSYPSVLRHVRFENTKFKIKKNANKSFLDFDAISSLRLDNSDLIIR